MVRKDYSALQIKFGENAKKLRDLKDLSLRDVAANCDLDDSKISKIENGKFNITLGTIVELAKGLDVEPTELLAFKVEV